LHALQVHAARLATHKFLLSIDDADAHAGFMAFPARVV
jgi:hypothetical protein